MPKARSYEEHDILNRASPDRAFYKSRLPLRPDVALALRKDFHSFERQGVIMQPDDKDVALLPHRIDGCWALIHRPVAATGADRWISYSSDLRNWVGCEQNRSLPSPD